MRFLLQPFLYCGYYALLRTTRDERRSCSVPWKADPVPVDPLPCRIEWRTAEPGARLAALEGGNRPILEVEPAWPRFRHEVESFLAGDG